MDALIRPPYTIRLKLRPVAAMGYLFLSRWTRGLHRPPNITPIASALDHPPELDERCYCLTYHILESKTSKNQ